MSGKLLSIIRREYVQGVRSKVFIISTVLGPVLLMVFTFVPGLLFGVKAGGATRVAVLDETGRLYGPVRESILRESDEEQDAAQEPGSNAAAQRARSARVMEARYEVEEVPLAPGASPEEARRRLDERLKAKELDAYIVLPADILERGRARYYARNLGDVLSTGRLENRLSRAVKEQRMREANIPAERVSAISREVVMTRHKPGEATEEGEDGSFFLALAVGMLVYIAILMYGQAILSAVVEEKTTRIVEVLFSSVRPFTLVAGKLVGVSLVGFTQYALWAVLFVGASLYGVGAAGYTLPRIPPMLAVYALLFFLLGFYVYATLYAVVGAMVTTEKEGAQLAFPVIMLLMAGIYLAFPVIRSPNSGLAFWVSMIPFFSPVTMIVRIVTETPPVWQIALSLAIGAATVVVLIWLSARIYRTGMLMYGKRATIPEVVRWVRQS